MTGSRKYKTRGSGNAMAKLSEQQVLEIDQLLQQKMPGRSIALLYGISQTQVHNIKTGWNWAWLTRRDHDRSTK